MLAPHAHATCTSFLSQEVVETINEFAFVASDYPVILSIENHCRKYPHLLQRMATIFKMVFGEKLLGSPLDDFPVRSRGGRERKGKREGERERERERGGEHFAKIMNT